MGLILNHMELRSSSLSDLKGASNIYIMIDKRFLSKSYDLPSLTNLEGEILDIEYVDPDKSIRFRQTLSDILEELKKNPISFVLFTSSVGTYDFLIIAADSWARIRDFGLISEQYTLSVKITKAILKDKTIEIYPKRDVVL